MPFLLLHPRTRRLGVAAVVGFHAAVGLLFPIGVFPWVMVVAATSLLDPSWPRRWWELSAASGPRGRRRCRGLGALATPRRIPPMAPGKWICD